MLFDGNLCRFSPSRNEPQPLKTAHLQTARTDSQTKVCKRAVFLPSLLINLKAIGIKCSAASQTVYIEFAIKGI